MIVRLSLLLALLLSVGGLWASPLDPAIRWKVIKTEHFRIVFDESQLELAKQYAAHAERARTLLAGYFGELPDQVTILINDSSDQPNGFATFLPYRWISVFPVLPDDGTSLENYRIWSEMLVTHEYTHILQFEPVHGFYRPLRYLFGRIVTPNALLPNWMMEGMAVDFESQLTPGGRLRSSGYEARLRALSADETLNHESLDRLNEFSIPSYPYGERPYFYGALLMRKANAKLEEKNPDYLLQRFSQRVPFLLDPPAQERFKKNWETLWSETRREIYKNNRPIVEQIRGQFPEAGAILKNPKRTQVEVRISPDRNRLALIEADEKSKRRLYVVERKDQGFDFENKKFLVKAEGIQNAVWSPKGDSLVFDIIRMYHRVDRWRDLARYDFATKKITWITQGQRASNPTFSPNGEKIAFISLGGGATELREVDLKSGAVVSLYKSQLQERISSPIYTPDGRLLFVMRTLRGQQSVYSYSAGKEPQRVALDLKNPSRLRATPDGILMVSDQNGARNAYLVGYDFKSIRPLTHVTTEVDLGEWDISEKEIYYTQLTSTGLKLKKSKPVTFQKLPLVKGTIDNVMVPAEASVQPVTTSAPEDYSPLRYMWPTYWIPFVYPASEGTLFQGVTSISDPLGRNVYNVQGMWDTFTEKGSYAVMYSNQTKYRTLSLLNVQSSVPLSLNSKQTVDSGSVLGSMGFYLSQSSQWPMAVGYSYTDDGLELTSGDLNFRRQGPHLSMAYTTVNNFEPKTASSETEFTATLQVDSYLKMTNFLNYERYALAMQTTMSSFLPDDHQLSVSFRSSFAPELPFGYTPYLGDTTSGAAYVADLIGSPFLVRGYPSGTFRGRKMLNVNLEYSLPFYEYFFGWGLTPLFLQDSQLVLFLDAVSVDGVYIDKNGSYIRESQLKTIFAGTGFEWRIGTTAFYKIPITFSLGYHLPLNDKTQSEGGYPFIGFGLGSLVNTTPPDHKPY